MNVDIASSDPEKFGDRADLVNRAAQSVKWSFLYNTIPRLVTPFFAMILAALLTPADFGLVAISTFVISLARIIIEPGLIRAVIQRQTQLDEAASTGLWISLLGSGALYLVIWIAAPPLSLAYRNVQVVDVVRVAALALPLSSLSAIPVALLRRDLEFRPLFWVNSSLLIISALSSVILAALGAGVWSLIWGQLIGMAISTGLSWRLISWRPMLAVNWPVLRSMLGFGSWVMVSGFQNWLFLYAGNTIAGLFLSVEGLGVFSLGGTVALLVPYFLVAALVDVAYPSFCKLQGSAREVGENLIKVQALAVAVLFPIALGISALAPTVVHLIYGSKWEGLGNVISILVIMPGLGHIWSLNEAAYQAVGRPDLWTKVAGFSLLVLLPLLWVTAPHGLLPLTLGRFGGAWILTLGNMYLSARILKIRARDQFKAFAPPLLISLGLFAVLILLIRQGSPFEGVIGLIKLFSIVFVGAITYLALVRCFQRDLWNRLFLALRRVLS